MAKILEKRPLTPVTKLYKVDAPLIARKARPGQFVIVRVREGGAVSYTHMTLPTTLCMCRSRWSPYH